MPPTKGKRTGTGRPAPTGNGGAQKGERERIQLTDNMENEV